jgi:hypothetical protein
MHPMTGGQNKEDRETWLHEEDDVWTGDDRLVPVATLGRPVPVGEDAELPDSAWEEAPVKAGAQRGGPRGPRSPGRGPQPGSRS